jgi:hypothetical protein
MIYLNIWIHVKIVKFAKNNLSEIEIISTSKLNSIFQTSDHISDLLIVLQVHVSL